MAKVISVEIGTSITRICEMDYKVKTPKVYKYLSIPTPKGVIEDGFIQENAEFALAFRRALSDNKIKTKQVVFTVASSKIVTREVTIPEIKMAQVPTYIKANANDYFPIDLSVYEIAHVFLGVERGEEGPGKYRVMVMAAGKDLISGYAKFATACGLKLMCVDYSGNSIYQVMRNEGAENPTLVVKIEDNTTIASVIVNRGMVLQRNLAYGFERAVNTLMESPEFYEATYSEAIKTMCQKPSIKVVINERTRIIERDEVTEESELSSEARTKITATFSQLIGNLNRLVELYNSKDPLNPIKTVILLGLGSEIANLPKLLTNELGIQTYVCKHLNSVSAYQPMDGINYGRYISAMGAAIEPVGLAVTNGAAKTGAKKANKMNYTPITIAVAGIGIAVSGYLFASSYLPLRSEQNREATLKADEARYQEAEQIHYQYKAIKQLQGEVSRKYKMTEHPNDGMVQFIQELEIKLPADITVVEMSSDAEKASIIIRVPELEEVAKTFQILRGFDSLMDVSIGTSRRESETEEDGTESDVSYIEFEALCYYYPIVVEDEQVTVIETESGETATEDNGTAQ